MKYLIDKLDKIVVFLSSFVLLGATFMLLFTVFYRYVIVDFLGIYLENNAIATWIYEFFMEHLDVLSATTDEIPGYLLVWISFLGAYLAERKSMHIKFDMLVDSMNDRLKTVLTIIPQVMIIGFFALLFWFSIDMIIIDGTTYIETIDIPQGFFMSIFPFSSIIIILAVIYNIIKELKCTS